MTNYYRVMLGRESIYAKQCIIEEFIGADFAIKQDLTPKLFGGMRDFNRKFIPIYLANLPEKTKVAAGLACGALWAVAKGIQKGDIVLCPNGEGQYQVGEIIGDYIFQPGGILPHRRPVQWYSRTINRIDMSDQLRKSTGSIGTISNVTRHGDEIELLLGGVSSPVLISSDETVEDPAAFAMEKHLEGFLVQNWSQTELAKQYNIYEEDGDRVGQQFPTDTGNIDILAISKDRKTLLVIELKKGRASDVVVGQILRYMGYVQEELAEDSQGVKGIIIALDDDQRIRRALAMTPSIEFFRYQISFKLIGS